MRKRKRLGPVRRITGEDPDVCVALPGQERPDLRLGKLAFAAQGRDSNACAISIVTPTMIWALDRAVADASEGECHVAMSASIEQSSRSACVRAKEHHFLAKY